jgi:hypothetical protein
MKLFFMSLVLGAGALGIAVSAQADTLFAGVLSPDSTRLICHRADANFFDFGTDGYGCHNTRLMISCRASLDCVSKVQDLNSYEGNALAAFMRQHGMRQIDPLSQSYSE